LVVTILKIVMPSNPPLRAGIGISSLNVKSNNFRTVQPTSVIPSSNDAAPQKKFSLRGQAAKNLRSGELLIKKLPKESFPDRTFHNFPLTHSIHTSRNSTVAARQVECDAKSKTVKI
jgi:hypothetical protein